MIFRNISGIFVSGHRQKRKRKHHEWEKTRKGRNFFRVYLASLFSILVLAPDIYIELIALDMYISDKRLHNQPV